MPKPCPHCNKPVEAALFYASNGGRPSKLTPELQEAICDHIVNGVPIEVAAGAEGVFKQRLHEWKRRGEAERDTDKDDSIYSHFADSIARAICMFEVRTLKRLNALDASEVVEIQGEPVRLNKIDPKVAAALSKSLTWLLERLRRERYGTLVTVKVDEAKTYFMETLLSVVQRYDDDIRLRPRDLFSAFLDELEGRRSEVPDQAGSAASGTALN